MKKIPVLFAFLFIASVFTAGAQETKTKPITTPTDKVHNVIHPKSKVSHGTKYKHKSATGRKNVAVVKTDHAVPMEPKKKVTTTK